jgi:hypothetical protein
MLIISYLYQRFCAVIPLLVLVIFGLGLSGCGSIVLTTPDNPVPVRDLFPNALLAEPILLRTGFTYITQSFEVTGTDQVWEVSVGFSRHDDRMSVKRFFCLVDSRNSASRSSPLLEKKCPDDEPGIYLKWELIRPDGVVLPGFSYDALTKKSNSQSSRISHLLGLGAFANQPTGHYKIKVTVLRDFPELDVTTPFIVIAKPFFRRR